MARISFSRWFLLGTSKSLLSGQASHNPNHCTVVCRTRYIHTHYYDGGRCHVNRRGRERNHTLTWHSFEEESIPLAPWSIIITSLHCIIVMHTYTHNTLLHNSTLCLLLRTTRNSTQITNKQTSPTPRFWTDLMAGALSVVKTLSTKQEHHMTCKCAISVV